MKRRAEPRAAGVRRLDQVLQQERAPVGLGRGQEECPEQRQRDADGGQHQVLPDGLERATVPPVEHERRERERRGLHPDPDQRQVMRQRHQRAGARNAEQAADEDRSRAGPVRSRQEPDWYRRATARKTRLTTDSTRTAERVDGQPAPETPARSGPPEPRGRRAGAGRPSPSSSDCRGCRVPAGSTRSGPPRRGAGSRAGAASVLQLRQPGRVERVELPVDVEDDDPHDEDADEDVQQHAHLDQRSGDRSTWLRPKT